MNLELFHAHESVRGIDCLDADSRMSARPGDCSLSCARAAVVCGVPFDLVQYAVRRDELLQHVVEVLAADHRFAAAWMIGSFGRGEQDSISDLDFVVVLTPTGSDLLQDVSLRSGTSETRRHLFEQFGTPLIIHETPDNAPAGGSFSVVIYQDAPVVDWTLIPRVESHRPHDSLLLFDHVDIPVDLSSQHPDASTLADRLAERWAFFWMMTLVCAKYWVRQDGVLVVVMLDQLYRIAADLERLLSGHPRRYRAASLLDLPCSPQEQADAIRRICDAVEVFSPAINDRTHAEQVSGRAAVDLFLQLESAR